MPYLDKFSVQTAETAIFIQIIVYQLIMININLRLFHKIEVFVENFSHLDLNLENYSLARKILVRLLFDTNHNKTN